MATKQLTERSEPATIRDRLRSPALIAELGKAMPKHCSPERMARVALTALTKTPKLADCTEASFFQCLLSLSQWGLEPDGRRAHLIPFENRGKGITECQLIIDYKGYVELAYRSGFVKAIHADLIREGDVFEYSLGDVINHVPYFLRRDPDKPTKAGEVYAAYCRVTLTDGITKTEVMSVDEINGIRDRSQGYIAFKKGYAKQNPWASDWNEMAKKTVWRRTQKWLPLSAEILDAMDSDQDTMDDTVEAKATRVQTLDELATCIAAVPGDAIGPEEEARIIEAEKGDAHEG
jgi:recombination protein RecT